MVECLARRSINAETGQIASDNASSPLLCCALCFLLQKASQSETRCGPPLRPRPDPALLPLRQRPAVLLRLVPRCYWRHAHSRRRFAGHREAVFGPRPPPLPRLWVGAELAVHHRRPGIHQPRFLITLCAAAMPASTGCAPCAIGSSRRWSRSGTSSIPVPVQLQFAWDLPHEDCGSRHHNKLWSPRPQLAGRSRRSRAWCSTACARPTPAAPTTACSPSFSPGCLSGDGGFTKATVQSYRAELEGRGLSASAINVQLASTRSDTKTRRRGGRQRTARARTRRRHRQSAGRPIRRTPGRELADPRTGEPLLALPDPGTLKGKRDRAILGLLLGCGLRRENSCELTASRQDGRSSTCWGREDAGAPFPCRAGSRPGSMSG